MAPIPGTELLNPWKFLNLESDPGVFGYVNEVPLKGPYQPRAGGWLPGETSTQVEGWKFQSYTCLPTSGKGRVSEGSKESDMPSLAGQSS